MRYYALAADYDGTLALHGRVSSDTVEALTRFRNSGRELILVTGRELEELLDVFPRIDLFRLAVIENGGALYVPETRETTLLTAPVAEEFAAQLRRRGVMPISIGRTIVATWRPNETAVLSAIRDLGLELEIIFNKEAVMVLPTGVNKATGLRAALRQVGLSPHNVAGIGDGENDNAFLSICEFSAAVANAIPILREQADLVTTGESAEGVVEFIDHIIKTDLEDLSPRLERHHILLGVGAEGREVRIPPYGRNILLAGNPGTGKSTMAAAFLEQLAEREYQFCVIDPEGDYPELKATVSLGSMDSKPRVSEVLSLLENPAENCTVNMAGVPIEDRAPFAREILSRILQVRTRTGHPHWIVADEAHYFFPSTWNPDLLSIPEGMQGLVFITVHPRHISPAILGMIHILIITGETLEKTLREFCEEAGCTPPSIPEAEPARGVALYWETGSGEPPLPFRSIIPQMIHDRHRLKYAEGYLEPEESFFFRGPEGKLNLRANNLMLFVQIAEGVDNETWTHHLRRGDYSRWLCDVIHDDALAGKAENIEGNPALSPEESRRLLLDAIRERYAAPA